MGKRSAAVELFLGDMGSILRELRPSTQREEQLTMETKLEQIAVKAVNQLPKSVVREIRTPRSVGAGGGRPPPATRWTATMRIVAIVFALIAWLGAAEAQERTITVASTTSTEQSGLFGY